MILGWRNIKIANKILCLQGSFLQRERGTPMWKLRHRRDRSCLATEKKGILSFASKQNAIIISETSMAQKRITHYLSYMCDVKILDSEKTARWKWLDRSHHTNNFPSTLFSLIWGWGTWPKWMSRGFVQEYGRVISGYATEEMLLLCQLVSLSLGRDGTPSLPPP